MKFVIQVKLAAKDRLDLLFTARNIGKRSGRSEMEVREDGVDGVRLRIVSMLRIVDGLFR